MLLAVAEPEIVRAVRDPLGSASEPLSVDMERLMSIVLAALQAKGEAFAVGVKLTQITAFGIFHQLSVHLP